MTWLFVDAILMIALPIGTALALQRWTGAPRAMLAWGAVSSTGAQLAHHLVLGAWQWLTRAELIPGVGETAAAIAVGVLAAACQEPARWLVLRRLATRGRSAAILFGAGHGGIEALGLGLLALLGALDIGTLAGMNVGDLMTMGIPEAAAETTVDRVAVALAMPWYEALGGAFESAITVPFHIACSVLVMASLRRRRAWPFVVALAVHATIDAAIGVLGAHDQRGWMLEMELTALSVPFTVLVLAFHAEPAEAKTAT